MERKKFTDSPHVRDSGIREIFLVKSGILGFGIRNTAQRIRNPPSSTDKESVIYGGESRIQHCRGFSYMGRADSLFV